MQQILTIEPSATQRYVLNNTLEAAGFGVVVAESADAAERALAARHTDLEHALEGVVVSWPDTPDDSMLRLMALLEQPDHHDLPVMVLSRAKRSGARAWVDARERSRMLDWRHQRNAGEALKRLLGGDPLSGHDVAANDGGLSVLVVDDSPSIRLAFGDLLRLHGYRVEVVASARDALDAVSEADFDIAVVDFYLGEQTGDTLIKQLISAAGGDLACAVLTSNYADHIIQQSLAAGAVACLFKSEPGDLLLARLDGIARLLASRARWQDRVETLSSMVHALPQRWVHIDRHGDVIDLSTLARQELGLDPEQPVAAGVALTALHPCFAGETGQVLLAGITGGSTASGAGWQSRVLPDGSSLLQRPQVERASAVPSSSPVQFSLLLIAAEFSSPRGQPVSIAANSKLVEMLSQRLQQRVIQADRIEYLGNGLFSIVLAHRTEAAGIVAAKQLMMTVVGIGQTFGQIALHSHGALVPVDEPDTRDAEALRVARDGAMQARDRGQNHVYLASRGVVLNADSRTV